MSRFVLILCFCVSACTTTINNNETVTPPAATDPVAATTDTDEVVSADTDTVDSDAPADTDSAGTISVFFTTALGPQGHVQLTPGQKDVNLGGFLIMVNGNKLRTVSQLTVTTYVDTDGDGQFLPAPIVGDYFSTCRLILGNNPESIIGFSAGQTDGTLSFFGSFQVQPGPTSGIIANVYCDMGDDYVQGEGPVEVSIDLPMLDGVSSDADPTEFGYSYQPGNDNGGNFPSRSAILPWSDPRCTQQVWALDGVMAEVVDLKPIIYIDQVSNFWAGGGQVSAIVSDDGCGDTFVVEYVYIAAREMVEDFTFTDRTPEGIYSSTPARMSVNGQPVVINYGQDTFGAQVYKDPLSNYSQAAWTFSSPGTLAGYMTGLLPTVGRTTFDLEIMGEGLTYGRSLFANGDGYVSRPLEISATALVRDTRPGGKLWYISSVNAAAELY